MEMCISIYSNIGIDFIYYTHILAQFLCDPCCQIFQLNEGNSVVNCHFFAIPSAFPLLNLCVHQGRMESRNSIRSNSVFRKGFPYCSKCDKRAYSSGTKTPISFLLCSSFKVTNSTAKLDDLDNSVAFVFSEKIFQEGICVFIITAATSLYSWLCFFSCESCVHV